MKDKSKTKAQLIEELETLRAWNLTLELREAERAQETARLELIARAAEQSTEGIAIVDLEGNLLSLNKAFANMHGYDPDELIGKNLSIFHTPEQMPAVDSANRELRETGTFRGEIWHARRYGAVFPTWMENSLLQDLQGNPIGMIGTVGNITELKQTEEALQESEKNYRTLVDNALVGIFRRDLEGKIYYVNQALVQMLEYDSAEGLRAVRFEDVYEDLEDRGRFLETLKEEGKVVGYELRLLTKTGKTRNVLVNGMIEGGIISGMTMDITERKAMEEELRENEERHRAMFEGSLDAIVLVDPETGEIVDANPAASQLFLRRRSTIVGLHQTELFPFRLREGAHEAFARMVNDRDQDEPTETTILRRDGSERPVEMMAHIIQIDGRRVVYQEFRDIWVRKRMEQELGNIQRLQSLGVLAGGIAHDFNNILTAILANVSMARLYGKFDEDISQMLADAEKASLRAQGLTQQLLTFAKGGEPIKKTVRISAFLQESAAFALSGSNTRCEYLMPDDIRRVEADEGQLIQVFQNLVINANQAMPEGGVVKIRAENVRIKEDDYVKISVEDQGIGIPEEHLSKIFDPFFTTKERGRGLGLAIAFSVVHRHGGHMEVESAPGGGTAFHVYLPANDSLAASGRSVKKEPARGVGRVLVVDDERIIRRSAAEVLKRLGYEVGSAKDGREGIEIYEKAREDGRPFDVVIMDLTIPGELGGKKAVGRLRELDPGAKVIVSSGYSEDPVMSSFREYGFDGVLVKPYHIADLAEVIRNVLLERSKEKGQS